MESFYCTYKQLRLFAQQQAEGWVAMVFDLDRHEWIDKGGWLHQTPERAKANAEMKASTILGERVGQLEWSA